MQLSDAHNYRCGNEECASDVVVTRRTWQLNVVVTQFSNNVLLVSP